MVDRIDTQRLDRGTSQVELRPISAQYKSAVRAATAADISLSGLQTVDGVALAAGDRVLVKAQTTASQNGIYVAAAGAWTRADDADTDAKVKAGMLVPVEEGTRQRGTTWALTAPNPIAVGTTALTFEQGGGPEGTRLTAVGITLNEADKVVLVDASAAPVTISLPTAASARNRQYTVKKVDSSANAVTVDPSGAETIDDAATLVISTQYTSRTFKSDGTEWWIL